RGGARGRRADRRSCSSARWRHRADRGSAAGSGRRAARHRADLRPPSRRRARAGPPRQLPRNRMTGPRLPVTVSRLEAPARLGDRAAILALEAGSFTNPWTADTFDRMLLTPVSQVYVARLPSGAIVGFCACWVIDDEMHINTVAVEPGY